MSSPAEGIPPTLRPPIDVALAKAVNVLPAPTALTGEMCFKWGGYRLIVFREGDRTSLWSRQGKDLTRYSVGVKRRRADVWTGESAVISARQVSLACMFSVCREPWRGRKSALRGRWAKAPECGQRRWRRGQIDKPVTLPGVQLKRWTQF